MRLCRRGLRSCCRLSVGRGGLGVRRLGLSCRRWLRLGSAACREGTRYGRRHHVKFEVMSRFPFVCEENVNEWPRSGLHPQWPGRENFISCNARNGLEGSLTRE